MTAGLAVETAPEVTVPRGVEARVTHDGLRKLIARALPLLDDIAPPNPDGTRTFDMSLIPEGLPTYPISLGPFESGVTLRDAVISFDPLHANIEPLISDGPLMLGIWADALPIRIDYAVVSGEASLAGFDGSVACVLKTEAPAITTTVNVSAEVEASVNAAGELSLQVYLLSLSLGELNLEVIKDCTLPECQDESGSSDPCSECDLCSIASLGPSAFDQLRDLLGTALTDLLTEMANDAIQSQLEAALDSFRPGAVVRLWPDVVFWWSLPVLGPSLDHLGPLDFRLAPTPDGIDSKGELVDLAVNVGARAPESPCGVDRPPLPRSIELPRVDWKDLGPEGADLLTPHDLAVRIRPDFVERVFDEILRSGLGCASLRPTVFATLLDQPMELDQSTLQLLLPERRFLGDPLLPLRLRLNVPAAGGSTLRVLPNPAPPGELDIKIELEGLEVIVGPDGRGGPTWLRLSPRVEVRVAVRLKPGGDLEIRLSELAISGLEQGLAPATRNTSAEGLLGVVSELASAFGNLDPIEIEAGAMLGRLLPGLVLAGMHQLDDGRVEIYLNINDGGGIQIPEEGGQPASSFGSTGGPPWALPPAPLGVLALALLLGALCAGRERWRREAWLVSGTLASGALAFMLAGSPGCGSGEDAVSCRTNADCGRGYRCGEEGTCVLGVKCSVEADCCAGAICSGDICVPAPSCDQTGCPTPGTACKDGVCLAKPCGEGLPSCPPGSACDSGWCSPSDSPLACSSGEVLDRAALRCMNTPPGCREQSCPPGQRLEVEDGPLHGAQCPDGSARCVCSSRPPPPPPAPDGSLAHAPARGVLWYDARYGDLLLALGDGGTTPRTPTESAAIAVAGVPDSGEAVFAADGWRGGVGAPGPDMGRAPSAVVNAFGDIYVAGLAGSERHIRVLQLPAAGGSPVEIELPPHKQVSAGPAAYVAADERPCVALVEAPAGRSARLVRFCAAAQHGDAPWFEESTVDLRSVGGADVSCPGTPCPDGERCVFLGDGTVACVQSGVQCDPVCPAGEACLADASCLARVAPQDSVRPARGPLDTTSGAGPLVAVTARTSPGEAVAVRFGYGLPGKVSSLTRTPAGGGRGLLDAAVMRARAEARGLLALDRPDGLVPWRWHDNADEPELLEALGAPGDPSVSRVRVVSAVSQEQGSLGWLVSTEPDDGLWWIPETDAGPGKPQPLERGPILGFGSAIGSRAVGWLLPEGFSEPVLTWWDIP